MLNAFRPFLGLLMLLGIVCAPWSCVPNGPADDPDGWAAVVPANEIEPNEYPPQATPVTFDATGRARLLGNIPDLKERLDVDFFALGPIQAGDRLRARVLTPDSELDALLAVFDAENKLFIVNDNANIAPRPYDPAVDEIIRHDSEYFIGVMRPGFAAFTGGDYELRIQVDRGGEPVPPRGQILLLNFAGGRVELGGGNHLTIAPFDAGNIDAMYAGRTEQVKRWIVRTVRQNFARFDLTIYSTDDAPDLPDDGVSIVYFGGYDAGGLGIALNGTDFYNCDRNDVAVVFTERFTPDLFTDPPDATRLGVAIGNIASHEAGHLFGLSHVRDAADVMNTYDAPDHLLTDQHFKASTLDQFVIPLPSLFYVEHLFFPEQDGTMLLRQILGRAAPATKRTVDLGGDPSVLVVADFDDDGWADLAVANTTMSEIYVLFNDEGHSFAIAGPFYVGAGPIDLAAADFDGDGTTDLAACNLNDDNIAFLFNRTEEGPEVGPAAVRDGPWQMVAADFNGNGSTDLAVLHAWSNDIAVLMNNGDATFAPPAVVASSSFLISLTAADLNGNGAVDLAYIDCGMDSELGAPDAFWKCYIVVLLNDGEGGFVQAGFFANEYSPRRIIAADVNQDGAMDLLFADQLFGGVVVMLNDGAAGFVEGGFYPTGRLPEALAVADLNGNGHLDVVVANTGDNDVSVLLNRGDGTFAAQWPYGTGASPVFVATADFNGDGAVDIAVAERDTGHVTFLFNRGDGTFADGVEPY
ncbi:MAG: hypothetical protein GXY44_14925 [Phycisphaerales bacterium]|nr:hypothetical protein [Phycisphaerales bacterium]